jgi:hypothetical protein
MEGSLSKYCPNTFSRMAYLIAYDYNLTPDTVKYNYLTMFIENGILTHTENGLLDLSEKGKALQTTEDGLTEQELRQEYEEEIQSQTESGKKPKVTFEEWKKNRPKRFKPLEP